MAVLYEIHREQVEAVVLLVQGGSEVPIYHEPKCHCKIYPSLCALIP